MKSKKMAYICAFCGMRTRSHTSCKRLKDMRYTQANAFNKEKRGKNGHRDIPAGALLAFDDRENDIVL